MLVVLIELVLGIIVIITRDVALGIVALVILRLARGLAAIGVLARCLTERPLRPSATAADVISSRLLPAPCRATAALGTGSTLPSVSIVNLAWRALPLRLSASTISIFLLLLVVLVVSGYLSAGGISTRGRTLLVDDLAHVSFGGDGGEAHLARGVGVALIVVQGAVRCFVAGDVGCCLVP